MKAAMLASSSTFALAEVSDRPVSQDEADLAPVPHAAARAARERALVQAHMPAIWRFLRRLGFSPEDADDATQEVFVIAVAKLDHIEPTRERSFLYGIAVRLASRHRRSQTLRTAKAAPSVDIERVHSADLPTDELIERKEARALLDRTLAEMTPELRTVFALFELEEMTMIEIAAVTDAPLGTVASRLRRAREQFQEAVKRFQRSRQ
jgi:RNA polymerase sigma-70 factor (ECF subfamily)